MKLLLYTAIFLQAALVKTCAQADKVILKEGSAIEKGLLKKEGKFLTKEGKQLAPELLITKPEIKVIENSNYIYSELKNNSKVAKEYKNTKNKLTDIIEHVLDLIPDDQIANTKSENSFLTNVINEIVEGSNGIVLKKIIIYNLKDDKFNNENLRTLLKGGKYDTLHFEPARLFGIYFRYSNLFADKTLQDIAAAVNCDKDKLKEIELIANKREISKNSKLFAEINKCY